jgi:NAD(P)-dependent dehydrogenase (short-subunit alcohol dehydrogenase family)
LAGGGERASVLYNEPVAGEQVVISGAGGSIGGEVVARFEDRGLRVVGVDRAPTDEWIRPPSAGSRPIVVDVADEAALEAELAATVDGGPIHHVVAVAGGAVDGEAAAAGCSGSLPVEAFRRSLEQNLVTAYSLVRAVLPALRRADGDRSIGLCGSFAPRVGFHLPAYTAAKAGLEGLATSLATQLGPEGIRVNVVAPGTVRTPRNERQWASDPGRFERIAAAAPLGRLAEPADVAAAFAALALDLGHVTGQVLVVDGGQGLRPPT